VTLAAKHGDPQLGVDIHLCTVPPGTPVPLPTPHMSIVFDPFDYVPIHRCDGHRLRNEARDSRDQRQGRAHSPRFPLCAEEGPTARTSCSWAA
jgi:hypothetical protein